MRVGFSDLRAGLSLRATAEGEGLKVKAWGGGGIRFECPACRKGGDGSGARARDGVTWRCVRCGEGGDVVDVLRLSRGLDASGAFREALDLAGLRRGDRVPQRGEKAPAWRRGAKVVEVGRNEEAPPPVGAADLAERHRAVRVTALHYLNLAGLALEDDDEDRATARCHVGFLAEREREGFGATARIAPDGYRVLAGLEADLGAARAYLMQRLGAAWPQVRPIAGELVGLCPGDDTGLTTWLRYLGGDALVAAARRADLIRPDGRETFAGSLVYIWTDARGSPTYLTGRAVPGLGLAQGGPRAKCPRAPHNNDGAYGLPPPELPFGAALADKRAGPVRIVEGELDAVHGLAVGPTVATGGAGRMGGAQGVQAIKRWLRGRDGLVVFDVDPDPVKRTEVDRRAEGLARAVGCRWVPARGDGDIAEGAE